MKLHAPTEEQTLLTLALVAFLAAIITALVGWLQLASGLAGLAESFFFIFAALLALHAALPAGGKPPKHSTTSPTVGSP